MNFEYEITADEYASAQALYHRFTRGRNRIHSAAVWILAGSFFIVVAWNQRPFDWAQFLLAIIGIWWIYAGRVSLLLPRRYFRRLYTSSQLAGKKWTAEISGDAFEVSGEANSWRVCWQAVQSKGEDKVVFMFYSEGTVFMFGKQYLTGEQQAELRNLSRMRPLTS